MPITGTEDALKQLLHDKIKQEMQAVGGASNIMRDDWFLAFCKGVAEAMIQHLVANVQVNPGQSVDVPGLGLTDSLHGAVTGDATGTVDTPGTIS